MMHQIDPVRLRIPPSQGQPQERHITLPRTISSDEGDPDHSWAIRQAVHHCISYLCTQQESNGKFHYRRMLDNTRKLRSKYNILRHAGCIYSLVEFHRRWPTSTIAETALRAGLYLKQEALALLPGRNDLAAIWQRPEICNDNKPLQAKLGGAGLGLTALVGLNYIDERFTSVESLRALGQFILYMQNADGSFATTFIPSSGGKCSDWISLYYPGEAALGLGTLFTLDPDPRWLQGSLAAIRHLATSRQHQNPVPADHWALLASKLLMDLPNGFIDDADRKLIRKHAEQITECILVEQVISHQCKGCVGGFANDGRTCPTATRLEGLLAAHTFLQDQHLLSRIATASRLGVQFLLRSQIQYGMHQGAIPRTLLDHELVSKLDPPNKRRMIELRIDYSQHALCAWMRYLDYFGNISMPEAGTSV